MVVTSEVPQGSVLGPLLFIMFINDIGNNLESDFLLYADDLKLFGTNPDSIAKDLVTISSWCDNWQMTVAPNKCECIRFSHMKKYAKLRPPALSIDGIRQGTTALIVLRIAKDIYVLNCGCSLALAVTRENAVQLNFNLHNKDNESEKQRIQYLGVDPNHVLNPTRAVGDLQRTHLYEECKDFSHAKGPPVISTPDVQHFKINDSWQHLILLSDGVIQNLKEVEVDDIPTEVFVRLSKDHTLTSTAQALADAFARKHLDAFITMRDDKNCCISSHREEMTVIVVKLSEEFYEKFDPTGSSLESTNATNDISYIKPYVDSTNFNSGKNYEKMKQIASK
uniref:PPM-type phosphatase domain-containing protein n=1 Tax=Caenorhabditis japonica TaxID=281687 RepID=A0A8R1E7Z4_CAEJA